MAQPTSYLKYIYVVLGLLVADGIISLAFLSTMVNFLHTVGSGPYRIRKLPGDGDILMHGEPAGLMTNQGHTTNAAGGTAVVLVGFGGLIALIAENRSRRRTGQSSPLFSAWVVATILSWLLTFSALVYTNVVTNQAGSQNIDPTVLGDNPFPAKYPLDKWTPENWYRLVLALPWQPDQQALRKAIAQNLRIQVGWRNNLIVLFILGFILMYLAVLELITTRRNKGRYGRASSAELEK